MNKKHSAKNIIQESESPLWKKLIWLIPVLIIAAMLYSGVSNFGFQMQWDDHEQVVNNTNIKSLSFSNLKNIFSSYVIGMYQPFTSVSYALDYMMSELNPARYHNTNLLIHLLNTFLVGFLSLTFLKRIDASLATALIFAVHPMQVETVAWISTRSNLLFTSFYLMGLIFYEKYTHSKSKGAYLATLLLMLLSCFSKSMAVTFPMAILAIDYFHNRKEWIKMGLEKIPFFALSLIFGIIAISYTDTSEIELDVIASPIERIVFIFYSIQFYLVKFVIPTGLSAAHYFPDSGQIPFNYYLAPIVIIAAVMPGILIKPIRRPYFFGLLFFIATIALVVLVPGRRTIVSERYVYLPYFGLLISLLTLIIHYSKANLTKESWNVKLLGITALLVIPFFYMSASRKQVWKDSGTLFSDVIEKYPENYHGYAARGLHFMSLKSAEEGRIDFTKAIVLKPDFDEGHYNLGIVYSNYKLEYASSIPHYTKAIDLKPDNASYLIARATALSRIKKYDSALTDFNKAIEIDSTNARAYENRGVLKADQGLWNEAIEDYTKSISFDNKNANTFISRGAAYSFIDEHNNAIDDYKVAVTLDPKNAQAYHNMGISYFKIENYNQACSSWGKAAQLGNTDSSALVKQYCSRK